jgi:DNA-binding MarR family transcriptional regulator
MPEIISESSPQIEAYRLFLKLHRRFQELNREEFRPYDLSPPQYAILFHSSTEGVPLSKLCEQMLADNSNLTRLVDRLEGRGLVRRAADPRDRRVTLVQLMSHLSAEQLAALHDAMQTLYENLNDEQ